MRSQTYEARHRRASASWAALLTAALVSGCGGGGGGGVGAGSTGGTGSSAASTFQLSFQPGALTAGFYEGEPALATVQVRASQTHSAPVQVAVIDSTGVLGSGVQITATSALVYEAVLPLSATLAAGTHAGTLEVRVCEDLPTTCTKPVGASPWRLPYEITVKPQIALTPLSPVAGAAAWRGFLGDGAHSATTALTLSAASFGRRWTVPATSSGNREGLALVDAGLVVNVVRDPSSGAPLLLARREHDGSVAWQRALGTVNDTPGIPSLADGSVYLFTSDFNRTVLWRVELATGALLGQNAVARYTDTQAAPLLLGGKLYACNIGSATDNTAGLWRYDARTLVAEGRVPLPFVGACTPATDGNRIYVFANQALVAADPGSDTAAYSITADTVPTYVTAAPVLDSQGHAFVAAYSLDSQVSGTSRLYAFDTRTRQLLWQVQGGFSTTPVVSGNTVFIVSGRSVEARSVSTGALLWTWTHPNASTLGDLDSTLVLTNTHLFVASRWTTDAIDLSSRAAVWGDTVGGSLALSPQGVLYISPFFTGGLRAINLR